MGEGKKMPDCESCEPEILKIGTRKYISLKKLPGALAESDANSPTNLSKPLTENEEGTKELGTPLGIFSIGNTSDPNKIGSEDRHKSLANKDQFRVYQNLSFFPHIQPVKLFGDNNSQSGRLGSLKKTFVGDSFNFNKKLSGTPASLMTSGGPTVSIAVQMGAVGDRTTSVASLPTFRGLPGADPDQHLSQFLTACVANNGKTEDICQPGHTEMLHSIPITGVSRKRKDQFTQQAVLFSVPFQGTLFSVNGSLKGFLGGVFGEDSSKGQGMHMDPSIASMFQAFSLSMQQQQSNDRKETLATKALQAVVNKIDQFDGRNISRYLRCYVREMELNRVSEKKMVAQFGLATIPEIRDHITSIMDRYGNSWEVFSHALKNEYFLEDADCVTKKLFLGWIERPNKNLQAIELLREFERQYSQLSKVEKLTLEPNKVDLFLQAANGELQEKLELLLEDKEEDEGLTTKWKNVEDAVGLLTKKEEG
uniref:Predicted protein n=1 Tax=Physcomitrium patens TaxID=3218 RepID=A9U5S2_PHYPA